MVSYEPDTNIQQAMEFIEKLYVDQEAWRLHGTRFLEEKNPFRRYCLKQLGFYGRRHWCDTFWHEERERLATIPVGKLWDRVLQGRPGQGIELFILDEVADYEVEWRGTRLLDSQDEYPILDL